MYTNYYQSRNYCLGSCKRVANSTYLEPINIDETTDSINESNPNKSIGHDGIPTKLIKAAKHLLSPFLANIFTTGLENSHFLDCLKITRVTFFNRRDYN